jgi:hypothetical protein
MDHDLPPELAPRRDELLARVTRRGRALRARRLGVLTTALMLVIGVPVAAFAVVADGGDNPHVAAVAPTTDVPAETSTSAAIEVLSVVPASPSVGEPVKFVVRTNSNCDVTANFGDEAASTAHCALVCSAGAGEPSTTEPRGAVFKSYQHVYTAAGDYTATFTAYAAACDGSSSTVSDTVSVHVVDRRVLTTNPESAVPPDSTAPNATVPQTTVPLTNEPMTVEVVKVEPTTPHVGDTVTFTVRATDPDSFISPGPGFCGRSAFGDGPAGDCGPSCAIRPPGTPTPPRPSDQTFELTHVYELAGDYEVSITVRADQCGPRPSEATASIIVHVSA